MAAFVPYFQAAVDREPVDNKRLSEARRQPGMMCSDTSGSYTLTECGFTPTGSWNCTHKYYRPGMRSGKSYHFFNKNESHFYQEPSGTQLYIDPVKKVAWKKSAGSQDREYYEADWGNAAPIKCLTMINPPPSWWVNANRVPVTTEQNTVVDRLDRYFVGKRPYDTWELDGPTIYHDPHGTQRLEVKRVQDRSVRIYYDAAPGEVPQERNSIVVDSEESDTGSESDQSLENEEAPRKRMKQVENTPIPATSRSTSRRTRAAVTGGSSNSTPNSNRQETSQASENKRKRPSTGGNQRSS
ncbi:hypothetical protein N7536_010724 [Penicillium majusculum]|nr:hypothetical protein N7536_010724 [Penicillium majusculum]